MIKLLHIHSDLKFIYDSIRYIHNEIKNEIIFIGNNTDEEINKLNKINIKYAIFNKDEIENILRKAKEYDAIIIYDLDSVKSQIIENKNYKQKVFLRLFGYELYGLKQDVFLSKKTFKIANPINRKLYSPLNMFKVCIKRFFKIEYPTFPKNQKELYEKIDIILLHNKYEYKDLSKFFYLPKLVCLYYYQSIMPQNVNLKNKTNTIIIGNSKARWNNHIDIINIIEKSKMKKNYSFYFFFSYGDNVNYSTYIYSKKHANYYFIEEFLNIDEFREIYFNASALIINSYRQHALDNIFTAINYGCKVYLNEKSSTYKWLKSEGFYIEEFKNLKKDLNKNNIKLTEKEFKHNIACLDLLYKKNTKEVFLNIVMNIVKS